MALKSQAKGSLVVFWHSPIVSGNASVHVLCCRALFGCALRREPFSFLLDLSYRRITLAAMATEDWPVKCRSVDRSVNQLITLHFRDNTCVS
jgi:hypothetical protein